MLTEKVVFCLVVVPTLWVLYGVLLLSLTDLDGPTVALILMTMPLFAYIGIVVTDAGMVDLKDLRPYFMRLFPSARKRLAVLPERRKKLQADLRAFIKSIGTCDRRPSAPLPRDRNHFSITQTMLLRVMQDLDWAIFTTPRST
jgi:glycerol-3-phosphate O-acyltransferase/dihydroxyacetone phosphate acyltransferase